MISLQERVHGACQPEGWELTKWNNIFTVRRKNKNSGMKENNLLSLSYGRVIQKDIQTSEGLLPENFEGYQIIDPGNIVLRLTDLQNDKRSLRQGLVTQRGIITSAYDAVEVSSENDEKFWFYSLLALDLAKHYYSLGGGVRQSVKFSDFPNEFVYKPRLSTQRKIGVFLDKETARIDALIDKNERLISLIDEKKYAYLRENFTPTDDDGCRLRFVASYQKGRVTAGLAQDGGEVPLLTADYVRHGQAKLFINDAEPDVREGDVLILWDGAGAGDILKGREGVLSSTLARFIPASRIDSEYLFYALKAREGILKNNAQGMGIPHVDGKVLKNLTIKLPSKEGQRELAAAARETMQRLTDLADKTRQMNVLLKEKRSALITAAVTGQIEIPEE